MNVIVNSVRHGYSEWLMTMRRNPFSLDPRKRGLRKLLGELESEIMEAVWRSGETTVRDVHAQLSRKRELAYTTVMTVMSRLAEKGLLRKRKGEGAALLYEATAGREEFTRLAVGNVLKGLLTDLSAPTMSQFVEMVGEDSDEKLDELAKLIAAKRRQKK